MTKITMMQAIVAMGYSGNEKKSIVNDRTAKMDERRERIIRYIACNTATSAQVAKALGLSKVTTSSDLKLMADQGRIRRNKVNVSTKKNAHLLNEFSAIKRRA